MIQLLTCTGDTVNPFLSPSLGLSLSLSFSSFPGSLTKTPSPLSEILSCRSNLGEKRSKKALKSQVCMSEVACYFKVQCGRDAWMRFERQYKQGFLPTIMTNRTFSPCCDDIHLSFANARCCRGQYCCSLLSDDAR